MRYGFYMLALSLLPTLALLLPVETDWFIGKLVNCTCFCSTFWRADNAIVCKKARTVAQ